MHTANGLPDGSEKPAEGFVPSCPKGAWRTCSVQPELMMIYDPMLTAPKIKLGMLVKNITFARTKSKSGAVRPGLGMDKVA